MKYNLNGMLGSRIAIFGFFFLASVGKAEVDLHDYEDCVRHAGAKPYVCTQTFYGGILESCRNQVGACLPWIQNAQVGGLSFKRCDGNGECELQERKELGDFQIHFVLNPGAERTEARDAYEAPFGQAMVYEVELKLPATAKLRTDNQSIVLAQLHAINGHSPVLALRWKDNKDLAVTLRHSMRPEDANDNGVPLELSRSEFKLGVWHRFRMEVKTGPEGRVRVFQNHRQLVDYRGPVGYVNLPNYFKFGLYDHTKTQADVLRMDVRDFSRRAGETF